MFSFDVGPGVGRMLCPILTVRAAKTRQLTTLKFAVVVEVVAMSEHAWALWASELSRLRRTNAQTSMLLLKRVKLQNISILDCRNKIRTKDFLLDSVKYIWIQKLSHYSIVFLSSECIIKKYCVMFVWHCYLFLRFQFSYLSQVRTYLKLNSIHLSILIINL